MFIAYYPPPHLIVQFLIEIHILLLSFLDDIHDQEIDSHRFLNFATQLQEDCGTQSISCDSQCTLCTRLDQES